MTARTSLLALLAACGNTAATPDAPRAADASTRDAVVADAPPDAAADAMADAGPALACLGHAASTTAADPVAVTGKVFAIDHYQVSAVAGTSIVLHARSDATIATASTAADGSFALSIASGGAPVDGYFTVTAAGSLPSRIDPGTPLLGGENELLVVAADAEVARWYADAGAPYVANSGALITATVDCATQPVHGSTLASAPTGTPIYYDDAGPRWDPALTASTNGYALVLGAPTSVTLTASIATTQLPARTVTAPSGTLSLVILPPTTD